MFLLTISLEFTFAIYFVKNVLSLKNLFINDTVTSRFYDAIQIKNLIIKYSLNQIQIISLSVLAK